MDTTQLTHAFAVFALFGLIWTIQLVHYPMFKLIEAPHWPRFHQYHSRNITFIVFPLMLLELLTALQLFFDERTSDHIIYLACSLATWLFTVTIFVPLHRKVATRPLPKILAQLTRLNWLRTVTWTVAAFAVFAGHFVPSAS